MVQGMGFPVIHRKGLLLLLALASLSYLSLITAYRAQASPASAGSRGRRTRTAHIRTGPHPGAKYNILQKVTAADVVMDPYPYIVIQNPLPDDMYDELEREYPTDSEIAKHGYAKGHATVQNPLPSHTQTPLPPHIATVRGGLCHVHASPDSSSSGIGLIHVHCSKSHPAAHAPPPPTHGRTTVALCVQPQRGRALRTTGAYGLWGCRGKRRYRTSATTSPPSPRCMRTAAPYGPYGPSSSSTTCPTPSTTCVPPYHPSPHQLRLFRVSCVRRPLAKQLAVRCFGLHRESVCVRSAQEVERVFGDAIRQVRPDLLERPHPSSLSEMKIKVRGTEDSTTDLRVDCQVTAHTLRSGAHVSYSTAQLVHVSSPVKRAE